MRRIKCIVEILHGFAVVTFFAFVQPYWHKRQQCKTLSGDKMCLPKQHKFIALAAYKLGVDVPQAQKLCGITPPLSFSKKIEHKHG